MKTTKKTIKKIFLIFVIFFEVVLMNIQPVQAGLFGGGSFSINVDEMLQKMENRYHLNKDSIQEFGEGFNVSSQKTIAPEVKLFFSPSSPKLGEKITASALPTGFQEGSEDLYFTWYLKHKDCGEGSSNLDLCDADGDNKVDANDWKVEAMRLVATNGFDRAKADYSKDTDNDGFKPKLGGNNNVQGGYYCYINDRDSGTNYEIATVHNNGNSSGYSCDGDLVCTKTDTLFCFADSVDIANNFEAQVATDSGSEPYCNPNNGEVTCPSGTTPRCITDSDFIDPTCSFVNSYLTGGGSTSILAVGNESTDADALDCSTEVGTSDDTDQDCEHQFADGVGTVGDGSFGLSEERFWGTDPNNPSTAGNGNLDEENVAGLGIDEFKWNYLPGDEIGVIVEGSTFLSTKHDDSSKEITFALPKNIFDKDGTDCQISDKESYMENIKGYNVDFPTASVNIDKCLRYNLIDPTNGDYASVLDTELSYSPENPSVGGNGVNSGSSSGDLVTVSASTSNLSLNDAEVYYKWTVYGTKNSRDEISLLDGAAGGWNELSDDADFRKANGIRILEGLGLNDFGMQLNDINKDIKFLRFYVEVEEYFGEDSSGSSGKTSSGRNNIVVPIVNSGSNEKMKIYSGNTLICENSSRCEILNNQVITAEVDDGNYNNFSWTLNGESINYLSDGDSKQGSQIKFLVQGDLGETMILNLIANDTGSSGNTGEKLNLSRNFIIVKPMVAIGPNNELNRGNSETCGVLNGGDADNAIIGTYQATRVNEDGTVETETVSECRENVFDANGVVTIPTTYYPSFVEDEATNVTYYVDGVTQDSNEIDLSSYDPGSMVNVSIKVVYNPITNVGEIARDWGVSQLKSTEDYEMTDSIQIKVTEADVVGVKKASKVIAGLAYNIPEQAMFIFRLLLIMAVTIFSSGVFMSLGKRENN